MENKVCGQYHGNTDFGVKVHKSFSRIKDDKSYLVHFFWWRVTIDGTVRQVMTTTSADDEALLLKRMSTLKFGFGDGNP